MACHVSILAESKYFCTSNWRSLVETREIYAYLTSKYGTESTGTYNGGAQPLGTMSS